MKVLERFDNPLEGGGTHSRKVMENGEVRQRVVLPDVGSVSFTTAEDWSLDQPAPWQTPHFHKGKKEVYTLISGLLYFVYLDNKGDVKWNALSEPGETLTFELGQKHNVLLEPRAVISTLIFGPEVGNPDRKGNDWWVVEGSDLETIATAQSELNEFYGFVD